MSSDVLRRCVFSGMQATANSVAGTSPTASHEWLVTGISVSPARVTRQHTVDLSKGQVQVCFDHRSHSRLQPAR
jgi:hypothetical protein